MKKWIIPVLIIMAAAALAADKPATSEAPPMQMGAPAEMKQLAMLIGTWDVAAQVKPGPNAEWVASKATCTFTSILDGAGMQEAYQGDFGGMPFNGTGIFCYNRETKKWQTSWIDNMSAMLSLYEGDYSNGKLVCSGEDKMNGMVMQSRISMSNITDKKFDWLLEESMDGGKTWMQFMKAVYTKK
jgi:hypothetical protein